jgi:hypothetical protein
MTHLIRKKNRQKAIDFAVWLNFKHRLEGRQFGAIQSAEGDFFIVSPSHPSFIGEEFEILPTDYSNMSFKEIRNIFVDIEPLAHFEQIKGVVSVMDGELLRFILKYQIPLEKFIQFELASRGYDENHLWCGFEKAEEIWLK